MNKPKFFSKLNRKGKLILGFMAVAIVSPIILAACGSKPITPNSVLGEKQALEATSLLLGYKQNGKNAFFKSIEQMENFYYTGNVDTKKPASSSDSSSGTMTPASKASIFSSHLYYYVVPGNPAHDPNTRLFYEAETKVMKKLSEITENKFTDISLLSATGSNLASLNGSSSKSTSSKSTSSSSGTPDFNTVAAYWWSNNYAGLQKRVQENFASYKLTGSSHNVSVLPQLKVLLAPNNEIVEFLLNSYINAYGKSLADNKQLVISTGWGINN